MTIFFKGHKYKYEIEGICKLFFPIERFNMIFGDNECDIAEDYIVTEMQKKEDKTLLSVNAAVLGKEYQKANEVSNSIAEYDNECERVFCVMLFNILSDATGNVPQWGILTGVRPVATMRKSILSGKTEADTKCMFGEKYLVSDKKLDLAFQTAKQQEYILNSLPTKSYSLYISIPFCNGRCSYCSFVSHSINTQKSQEKIEVYVRLLKKELEYTANLANEIGLQLDTIYIGGGTPTAISALQLEDIMRTVNKSFDLSSLREYTVEAGRADSITMEKLRIIKEYGADRVSVNPQTFNDDVLKSIGRRHTSQQAIEAFEMAKSIGFKNINMDLISGLPGDSEESFKSSIDKAVELEPSNITVHTLTIKRSADLFNKEWIKEYAKSGITVKMNDYAQEKLISSGYSPYYLYRQKNTIGNLENVGFSKNSAESLYNVYIMDEIQTILACGAGGVTKLVARGGKPIERIFNFKYHFEYIDRFNEILERKQGLKKFNEEQML